MAAACAKALVSCEALLHPSAVPTAAPIPGPDFGTLGPETMSLGQPRLWSAVGRNETPAGPATELKASVTKGAAAAAEMPAAHDTIPVSTASRNEEAEMSFSPALQRDEEGGPSISTCQEALASKSGTPCGQEAAESLADLHTSPVDRGPGAGMLGALVREDGAAPVPADTPQGLSHSNHVPNEAAAVPADAQRTMKSARTPVFPVPLARKAVFMDESSDSEGPLPEIDSGPSEDEDVDEQEAS